MMKISLKDKKSNTKREPVWFLLKENVESSSSMPTDKNLPRKTEHKYGLKKQNEDQPMDLETLQDIFSFNFMNGRPVLNFFLAVLWSIGLPILIYNVLQSHIGQVAAMITASAPPLVVVLTRMFRDRTLDLLGCIAGFSFFISGILSIIQPSSTVSAVCESIIPFILGLFCILSVIPIKIGTFELKPLVFQLANQVMPRTEDDTALRHQDIYRMTDNSVSGRKKLGFLYTNMAKFRRDMRYMTFVWGIFLIASCAVKIIVILTSSSLTKAQIYGYIIFSLTAFLMAIFTWFYTKIIKGHVISQVAFWKEKQQEEAMSTLLKRSMSSSSARQYKSLGDEVWKGKVEKINAELFTLTYGSMVVQLVKDFEDYSEVNKQLEKM
ncbi:hypothetical protein BY458DRAFT_535238 [Sporodiniella umbellata]|nr:hypothetical protein BY458DRAFT_535238 [Sporodiniella umbellata]